jgi:hypothetical protein
MAGVQRAHGRDEADDFVFGAREAGGFFHPGYGSDYFHGKSLPDKNEKTESTTEYAEFTESNTFDLAEMGRTLRGSGPSGSAAPVHDLAKAPSFEFHGDART